MESHFHMKGYVSRLALKKRYKATRKWPIDGLWENFTTARATKLTQNLQFLKASYLWPRHHLLAVAADEPEQKQP